MAFLIGGANTTSTAAYSVANSCRFNRADSATLSRTLASGSSTTKFTLSFWFKAYTLSGTARFFHCDGTRDTYMRWNSTGTVEIGLHDNSGDVGAITTNRLFRDPSSWMHFVVRFDSTESAENDRFRFYVNGVDERGVGGYSTDTMPDADDVCQVNLSGNEQHIGGKSAQYVDGYLAEMILSMGYSYAPTEFGEFDDDSPAIWKPKEFGGTIGTNGFYLDFEASGNLGNDVSGGTDFDENNIVAADQATDSPTNNFCTWNPLVTYYSDTVFTQGNLTQTSATGEGGIAFEVGTFGLTAGKWYWEAKMTTFATSGGHIRIGVSDAIPISDPNYFAYNANSAYSSGQFAFYSANGNIYHGADGDGGNDAYGNAWNQANGGQGVIISVAMDLDNNKLYFAKDGTWEASGDPAAGSNGFTITAATSTRGGQYFPAMGQQDDKVQVTETNFGGCPAFAISSGNADDNGYGNFEYDVPAGFLAICTKNLGSDGG